MNSDSDSEDSYYNILEIKKTATPDEIKKKRRDLSMKYHPDKLPSDKREWGEDMMKKVNEAYNILSDPSKRKDYDRLGRDFENIKNSIPGFNNDFDPEDMIRQFRGPCQTQEQQEKQKVEPIMIFLDVTMEEIYSGFTVKRNITRVSFCQYCNSTGFEDKKKHNCATCKGKGHIIKNVEITPKISQPMKMPCLKCESTGNYAANVKKCKFCFGKGIINEKHIMEITMEPGIAKDNAFEISNEGHEIPKDVQEKFKRGSVVIRINELPHSVFKRGNIYNGKINKTNISMELEIDLCESLIGFVREIKCLDGNSIYIDNYDIIQNNDTKVIKGKGIPQRGSRTKFGDLFIKFKVKLPPLNRIPEKNISKLYQLLEGKKYDSRKLHTTPTDIIPVDMKTSEGYINIHDINGDDSSEGGAGQGCAQQ
jgi:DnaJ-class molecular chaperone